MRQQGYGIPFVFGPAILSLVGLNVGLLQAQTVNGTDRLATLYGPQTFLRQAGPPVTEVATQTAPWFEHRTELFVLHLRNGDASGKNRVSSASVSLEGRRSSGSRTSPSRWATC